MPELPEPPHPSQETPRNITSDQQDPSGGRMVQTTDATVKKVLVLYTRHNPSGEKCWCRGCTDIREVLVAYLDGWRP